MSHSSAIFNRVPVEMPNKSGFNMDHENGFTAACGTLTPCFIHPLLPNDTISLGTNFQIQLPPMVTDFYGKIDACIEAFFVPYRLLWGGWEDFITHPSKNPRYPEGTNVRNKPTRVPTITYNGAEGLAELDEAGSLADFLGAKVDQTVDTDPQTFSALPWLAYHMIYHHWYRDSRIQAPVFYPSDTVGGSAAVAQAPYVSILSTANPIGPQYLWSNVLGDGVRLCDLRQRNWSKGYFTTASPYPQAGGDAEVTIDVANDTGAFSIATLRMANSLQKWMERNNFSYEYGDQIHAQYGIYPDAAKMDKPIFLGRVREVVYSRSVFQTAQGSSASIQNVTGSKHANAQAIGEGTLIKKFTASEHGYLMCIFSLVPHGYYSTGCNRFLFEFEAEDIPFPLLAGMGDQPIYTAELSGAGITGNLEDSPIFGYTDLYAHYKYMEDEVHGHLRDGKTLQYAQLQRSFGPDVELGSEFLEIPTDALDQIMAISTSTSGFSCWSDVFFKYTKISTLPAYSLPTLGDLKFTHTEHVSRGGSRL